MGIASYIIRRISGGLLLLLVLSLLVFGLLEAAPGSPIQILLGTRPASPGLLRQLRGQYHLDEPLVQQYLHWLAGAVHLDFGTSISVQPGTPVIDVVSGRTAVTVELAVYCLLLVLLLGVPLGLAAGLRRGRAADRAVSLLATVGVSAPAYALSLALLYVFGVTLGWFPVFGAGDGITGRIAHLTLPAATLAVALSGVVIRQTRAAALAVAEQDHLVFARLRGLSPGRLLVSHVLRNSALPVLTSAGMLLVAPLSAAIFTEQVFSLPGEGSLMLAAVNAKDIPVVQALTLLLGALVVAVNLLVDLVGMALDPRVRAHAVGEE